MYIKFKFYQKIESKFELLKDADKIRRFVVSKNLLKTVGTPDRFSGAPQFLSTVLKID